MNFTRLSSGSIRCVVSHPSLPKDGSGQRRTSATIPRMRIKKEHWRKGWPVPTAPGYRAAADKLETITKKVDTYLTECAMSATPADPEQVKAIIRGDVLPDEFGPLYDEFTKQGRGKGRRDAGRNVQRFADETRYNLKLSNLTQRFYIAWNEWRIQQGLSDNSFKTYSAHLKKFCKWCIQRGYAVPNDFQVWEVPKGRAKGHVELDGDMVTAIVLWNCPKELKPVQDLFKFQYLTGMRYVDTQRTEVFFDEHTIRFTPQKTRNTTRITVKQSYTTSLHECVTRNRFLYNRHAPLIPIETYNKGIKKLARLAGLTHPVTIYKDIGKAIPETRPFYQWLSSHDARHARANHLVQAGVSLEDVAQFLGDTVKTVENTYYHKNSSMNQRASMERIRNKMRKAK